MSRALLADLKELAKKRGTSASAQVVAAIEAHLERVRQEAIVREHSPDFRSGVPLVQLEAHHLPRSYRGEQPRIAGGAVYFTHTVSGRVFVGLREVVERETVRLLAEEYQRENEGQSG